MEKVRAIIDCSCLVRRWPTGFISPPGLQVKLIDFEFSLSPGSSTDDVVCCGTPGYCAPESSQAESDRNYTVSADSFAIMFCCCSAYSSMYPPPVIQAVLRNGGAADVFAAGLVLLEDCWTSNTSTTTSGRARR